MSEEEKNIPEEIPEEIPERKEDKGDYNADGKNDLAVFDSNTGNWFIRTVSGTTIRWRENWGWPHA